MTVVVTVALTAYVVLCLAYWSWVVYGLRRTLRRVPRLSRLDSPQPERWPKLSVVVPACDEADKFESAVRTLLDEDYPDLEILLVDDRSTDSTGAAMDRVAAADPRVRVFHVTSLPEGWIGKVNALDLGLKASKGEFVLFTDADVHFRRGTLRRAIAYCCAGRLDHLAALPDLWPTNLLLDAALSVTIRQLVVLTRPWNMSDPRSRHCMGVGAFNLVRRSAFDATPGFEWLRLEVADDMGLALMMKRSGARCQIVSAFDHIALHWYRTVAEAARGSERLWAPALCFSLSRAAFALLAIFAFELSPLLTLLPLLSPELRWIGFAGIAVFLVFLLSALTIRRWVGGKFVPALAGPLAAPLLAALLVRAAFLGWKRGGVLWRGTLYPAPMLRAGKRVFFP
jgi:cellulose synthase/poly-beta-1,6-N-acetylglucosamine synthase-like glycosyltransferase